jgi:hypothetical protein
MSPARLFRVRPSVMISRRAAGMSCPGGLDLDVLVAAKQGLEAEALLVGE